ncbi:MAG: type II secretion system protein [Candidatus Andersenbacteria bacterium]
MDTFATSRLPLAHSRGYTLIEIIVAIGIFSLLLLIIMGIFSQFVFTERRHIGEQKIQADLRFALELLNREVRTGYGNTFTGTSSFLFFRNQNGTCVSYRHDSAARTLARAAENVPPEEDCSLIVYSSYDSLVSRDTQIDTLTFIARAANVDPDNKLLNQGFVTISVAATSRKKSDHTVTLQSSVTSRQVIPFLSPP